MRGVFFVTAALAVMFSTQASAQQSQCTKSELDLVCVEGQVLRGINPDGTKICVTQSGGVAGCPSGYLFQGVGADGAANCISFEQIASPSCGVNISTCSVGDISNVQSDGWTGYSWRCNNSFTGEAVECYDEGAGGMGGGYGW